MSDEAATQDAGNRATVAQTLAEVRGLRDLTRAEFANTQRQLDLLAGIPTAVAGLQAQNADQERRISAIEDSRRTDSSFRRVHMPTLLFSAVVALAAIGEIVVQLAHH